MKTSVAYVFIFFIALLFVHPLYKNLHNTGVYDWDQHCYWDEVARKTILEYHQFPLWNPYSTGGRPLLANYPTAFLRPGFLFTLIFGCVVGLKIELFFVIFLALIGMYLLSEHYNMSPEAGILSAALFGLSGFFSLHISAGQHPIFPFYFLPFIFLFFLKSFEKKQNLFYAAISMALVILSGGIVYVFVPVLIFLTTYSFLMCIQKRNFVPIFNLVIICVLCLALSSIKVIPTLEYSLSYPRPVESVEKTTINGIYNVLLGKEQNLYSKNFDEQIWPWMEYGAYVGLLPLCLFLFGSIIFWRREFPLIISGFSALVISLGDFAGWAPWPIMHKLPLLSSTHVPSRFIIMFLFSVSIIASLFISLSNKEFGSKKIRRIIFAVVIFILIDLLIINGKTFDGTFTNPEPKVRTNIDFMQVYDKEQRTPTASSSMYRNLLANLGTLNAYEVIPSPNSAVSNTDTNYKGEVYLQDDGNASYAYWSPNKLIVNVDTKNISKLTINQNYAKGWHTPGKKQIENFKGLLSVEVSKSDSEIELYYLPFSFIIGTILSVSSAVFVIVCINRKFFSK